MCNAYPKAAELGFVHTFHKSGGDHGFEKDLYPLLDWHVLGDVDLLFSCGSTYSRTAWARRARVPFFVHTHIPHKEKNAKGRAKQSPGGPPCFQVA